MTILANQGPFVSFGKARVPPGSGIGVASDTNPDLSPSLFDQGVGILDVRYPFAYEPGMDPARQSKTHGWFGSDDIVLLNQVPSTATTDGIAAAQAPAAGVPLNLVAASGAGITVGASVVNASTGVLVTGLLAIDGAMGVVNPAPQGGFSFWDPTKALARCIRITSLGDDSAATALISGFDIYGYPMTDQVALTDDSSVVSTKAFKYVQSIVPSGTLSGSNVSAGQADTVGFMLRVDYFQFVQIYWPDTTLISASTGFTAADTTSPATSLTGDVRGTYALQSASNNAERLIISMKLQLANATTPPTGLVGVTQA